MQVNWFKYFGAFLFVILGIWAFHADGIQAWSVLLFAFIVVPLLDVIAGTTPRFLNKEDVQRLKEKKKYDWLLYAMLPLQYTCLFFFLHQSTDAVGYTLAGRIFSMGVLCGVLGINVAHELGHRTKPSEQAMAKLLLITSCYGHFFVEHNRGHHKKVATPEDPASARKNESMYAFWLRSVVNSYLSAWKIENESRKRKKLAVWHPANAMVQIHAMQLGLWLLILLFFGSKGLLIAIAAGIVGFLLLESIDYIEHYGLARKEIAPGVYERVNEMHSWNCNHLPGRVLLFELSLHTDHHMNASIPYQGLSSHSNAPQLPTGYPGSMILALIPPLWFKIMNKRIEKYGETSTIPK